MDDLISRQAAIDLLKQMRKDGDMVPWEGKDVFARIRKLPSVQPKRGKWIEDGKCDQCSGSAPFWPLANTYYYSNFCPHCGADMRTKETDCDYERAVEQLEHDMLYEPTFDPDDGSM